MKSINMKNKGITLVEILVVVAISSIMVGITANSISLAFSRDAERCARTIDVALESVRMSSMSQKGTFTLEIDRVNNQLITHSAVNGTTSTVSENLQSQVTVSFPDIDAESLKITFYKSSGKVKSVINQDNSAVQDKLIRIKCTNGSGSKVATVVLIRNTGRHYVEYGN